MLRFTNTSPTETKAAIFAFCYNNVPLWDDIVFHSLSECEFKTCLKTKWVEMGLDSGMMLDYARTENWANIVHKLYENGEDSLNYLFAYYYFGGMIELLENWHYPLIGFMNRVESYYGTETRDALDGDTLIAIQYLSLSEYHIYGSSRLGILKMDDTLKKADIFYRVWLSDMSRVEMSVTLEEANRYTHDSSHTLFRGRKMYEGTNHLGNVLVVYSDKRLNVCNADTVTYYRADLVQATDYSAFGVVMEEREWYVGTDSSLYRFSFNGAEKDDEVNGVGNSLDFGARIYDSRLGRWLSVDPMQKKYPGITPYRFSFNSPLLFNDPDGKDERLTIIPASAAERAQGIGGKFIYETTVYLYGADASAEMAKAYQDHFDHLQNTADVIMEKKLWTVQINVNYVYSEVLDQAICANGGEAKAKSESLKADDFIGIAGVQAGDNIMLVDRTLTNEELGVSNDNVGGVAVNSSSAKLRSIGTPADAIHETLHLAGMDERYFPALAGLGVSPHPGFGNKGPMDVMTNSPSANDINEVHFYDKAKAALSIYNEAKEDHLKKTGKTLSQFKTIFKGRVDDTNRGNTAESAEEVNRKRQKVSNKRTE